MRRRSGISANSAMSSSAPSRRRRAAIASTLGLLALAALAAGCDARPKAASAKRPNFVVIVWDTVRRDRMSLYGHANRTTPFVDEWAKSARVFDNCISAGSTTVPGHAAMFTGQYSYQHGADNEKPHLSEDAMTIAELLRDAGYGTYLFAANPHIGEETRFSQGFLKVEHPWSPAFRDDAIRILRDKLVPEDISTELAMRVRRPEGLKEWNIKTAGELAQRGVMNWLNSRPKGEPYFVLINYMEAHRPLIPTRAHRERFMTPEQIQRSYKVDRTWIPTWSYTFGFHEYTPDELELTALTYDAALAELDDFFGELMDVLAQAGRLENTVVVLTADHGEHLGDHHMLDHQYSVYNELLYIPMVVHAPGRIQPGRDARPVSNMDLFPTLIELAGLTKPAGLVSRAVSLLHPVESRPRMAEYPTAMTDALRKVKQAHPRFEPRAWDRSLRAYYDGNYKLIWASDGRHELYDVVKDPGEHVDLAAREPEITAAMLAAMDAYLADLPRGAGEVQALSEEARLRLEGLGYVHGVSEDDDESPTSVPASQGAGDPGDESP